MTDIKFPTPPDTIFLVPDTWDGVPCYVWCEGPALGLEVDADEAIEYTRKSDWISGSPEPTLGNKVWAITKDGFQFECEYDGEDWCSLGGDEMTHHMALPAPPKEKDID